MMLVPVEEKAKTPGWKPAVWGFAEMLVAPVLIGIAIAWDMPGFGIAAISFVTYLLYKELTEVHRELAKAYGTMANLAQVVLELQDEVKRLKCPRCHGEGCEECR